MAKRTTPNTTSSFERLVTQAPDIIYQTDRAGRFTFVNDFAIRLFEFEPAEVLGQYFTSLIRPDAREEVEAFYGRQRRDHQVVSYLEFPALSKSGREVWVGQNVHLQFNGTDLTGTHAVARDITARKRKDQVLEARLRLTDLVETHETQELLVAALDEAELLTGSRIAFYHFVNDDEETLSLQAWSTRTMAEFCNVVGMDRHYDVEAAGVWADSLRQRAAVVHNDYQSVPGRRGLPDGHSAIVRELVVPVLRAGRIVALVGVGNKERPYDDSDGDALLQLADLSWDIIDRARAFSALRQQQRELREAQRVAGIGSWVWDLDAERLTWSEELYSLMGMDAGQPPPAFSELASWLSATSWSQLQAAMTRARDHGDPHNLVLDVSLPDGSHRWLRSRCEAERRGDDGPIVKLRGTLQDITSRVDSDQALRVLALAVDQVAETVVITDESGRLKYCNPAFERTSGYTSAEAYGQTLGLVKSGRQASTFYEQLWATISSGQTWTGQFVNRRKDGTEFVEDATISPIRDDAGTVVGYVGVKRDVTERLRLEQQLTQAQRLESIGRLAGGIAHDFNNLLTVVSVCADALIAARPASDASQTHLTCIASASQKAATLTRQLLAFGRQKVVEPVPLRLHPVLREHRDLFQPLAGEDIRTILRLDAEDVEVLGDASGLNQVLMNLSVNARDAMPRGGELRIQTAIVDVPADPALRRPAGPYVRLSVSDTGMGMDERTRARIFDPYFTTKGAQGNGLGLSVAYGVIEQLGGWIDVSSLPGAGTTFDIFLQRLVGSARTAAEAPHIAASVSQGGTETILVVEDQAEVRSVIETMLTEHGYDVLACASAHEAIDVLASTARPVQLLLTDIGLPAMNGIDLAIHVRQMRPSLPVLFMSGHAEDAHLRQGSEVPGAALLQKPLKLASLLAGVRSSLEPDQASGQDRNSSEPGCTSA